MSCFFFRACGRIWNGLAFKHPDILMTFLLANIDYFFIYVSRSGRCCGFGTLTTKNTSGSENNVPLFITER
jgi:hypothetical protein